MIFLMRKSVMWITRNTPKAKPVISMEREATVERPMLARMR